MDILLGKVTQQAMNYAIRSGVTITTGYALKQCGRLLKQAPRGKEREEIARLQVRLEGKIRIISPAIDMIELISARGNTSLESAVRLTKEIRYEIQRLGVRLNNAANDEELLQRQSSRAKSRDENVQQLRSIIADIKALLERIEDAVPLINLAITTSGVNLSTKLSGTISPSRLLQASTFLTAADSQYTTSGSGREQVGPTYVLSLYMLFAGHARPVDEEGVRDTTWKEVIHKARVKLIRLPLDALYDRPGEANEGTAQASFREDSNAAEFAYQLLVVEDLDDDRHHSFEPNEPQPGPFDDVSKAGIRDVIPIHEVSKIFYADTGKILNIGGDGETNNPVLLLKRDVHAAPPRRMMQRSQSVDRSFFGDEQANGVDSSQIDAQIHRDSTPNTPLKEQTRPNSSSAWRLPFDLDPEWMAFEVFTEDPDSDSEDDEPSIPSSRPPSSRQDSTDPALTGALSKLTLRSATASPPSRSNHLVPSQQPTLQPSPYRRAQPAIKTSLSLLEMLIKLAALQQFRQEPHLSIEDELLNFFLEDSATAGGAGGDKSQRRHIRQDANKRIGFDPYDESPIKRRSEAYIQRAGAGTSPRAASLDPSAFAGGLPCESPGYGHGYGYDDPVRQSTEHDDLLSSPSPQPPLLLHQTPHARSSPAGFSRTSTPSTGGRQYIDRTLATPPSTAGLKGRSGSEAKGRSPLGREVDGK